MFQHVHVLSWFSQTVRNPSDRFTFRLASPSSLFYPQAVREAVNFRSGLQGTPPPLFPKDGFCKQPSNWRPTWCLQKDLSRRTDRYPEDWNLLVETAYPFKLVPKPKLRSSLLGGAMFLLVAFGPHPPYFWLGLNENLQCFRHKDRRVGLAR